MVKRISDVSNDEIACRDANFMREMLKAIGAFAWKSFLEKGKGFVIIDLTSWLPEKGFDPFYLYSLIFSYNCFENTNLSHFTKAQLETIFQIKNEYDPYIGAAVLFTDDTHVNAYKISMDPCPPEAYEALKHYF